jgi:pimeloyl-ACP methyl ester carboxylesterase
MSHLPFTEVGTASGPPLVLLHPGGMLGRVWQPWMREWDPRHRVIALDILPIEHQPSLRRHASDVVDFLHTHVAGPAHLIGASLGANIALHVAVGAPEHVASLVLDSAQAGGPPNPALKGLVAMLRIADRLVPTAVASRMLERQVSGYTSADRAAIAADLRALGLRGLANHIGAHIDHDVREHVGSITAPTLILAGATDLLTRRGEHQRLAKAIGGAELYVIPDAGHVTFLRQPARFTSLVTTFLERHDHR